MEQTVAELIAEALESGIVVPDAKVYADLVENGRGRPKRDSPLDDGARRHPLRLRPLTEIAAEIETQGPREFDVEGIVIHGQHGVDGSTPKAGKGFDVIDLSVSVASGTAWLGRFGCPNPGTVALFPGEEDDHELWRRLVAVAEPRGLDARLLPIHMAANTPRISRPADLRVFRAELEAVRPRLTIIDPMYKATAGGDPRSLVAMGELLSDASDIAREVGSSLLMVPHFNRDTTRKGADRFTGAGAQEWGRFLIAGTVTKRRRTAEGGSEVVRKVEVSGTSIADSTFMVCRRITAVNPSDPDSPLVYEVEVTDTVQQDADSHPELDYSLQRVLSLLGTQDEARTIEELQSAMKAGNEDGKPPYGRQAFSDKLNRLAELGVADGLQAGGGAKRWWRTDQVNEVPGMEVSA